MTILKKIKKLFGNEENLDFINNSNYNKGEVDFSYYYDYRVISEIFTYILSIFENKDFVMKNLFVSDYSCFVVYPIDIEGQKNLDIINNKRAVIISINNPGNYFYYINFKNFNCYYPYLNSFLELCSSTYKKRNKRLMKDDLWGIAFAFIKDYKETSITDKGYARILNDK